MQRLTLILAMPLCILLTGCLKSSTEVGPQTEPVSTTPADGVPQVRGDFYQGGDDILLKLNRIRRKFSGAVTKLIENPDRYPLCEYFGCREDMDPHFCEMMEEISLDPDRQQDCLDFIERLLPEWSRVAQDAENIPILLTGANLEVDDGSVAARTEPSPTGPIYVHWYRILQLLDRSLFAAAVTLIHEFSHKSEINGAHPRDDNGGREQIDQVSLAMSYFMDMSRDTESYLLDREYRLRARDSFSYNTRGVKEKYINMYGDRPVFILPDGGVYAYGSSITNSTKIAQLSEMYHAHPEILFDTPLPHWDHSEKILVDMLAKDLDERLALESHGNNFSYNAHGMQEKWFYMSNNTTSNWVLYIVPDGTVYWYYRSNGLTQEYARLSPKYWENPELLVMAGD